MIRILKFWLSDHPSIVGFRWNDEKSWGSSWAFLFASIASYFAISVFIHVLLNIFCRRTPIQLGPIPALHSLSVAATSTAIFFGILFSVVAEIRQTRWFWRCSKTPFLWLICLPIGTRSSGRVFFWSYAFYLSRFLIMGRTFITVIERRRISVLNLFNHAILLCVSFLWLEYSQSVQVPAIVAATGFYVGVNGYKLWMGGERCSTVVWKCRVVLLGCNVMCNVGVFLVHFTMGDCNGIEAWVFSSLLNGAILFMFLSFYVRKKKKADYYSYYNYRGGYKLNGF